MLLLSFGNYILRYFGSAEGSKFVEMASVDNVKRTWVNYGILRDWTDPVQGQVKLLCNFCLHCHCITCSSCLMSWVLLSFCNALPVGDMMFKAFIVIIQSVVLVGWRISLLCYWSEECVAADGRNICQLTVWALITSILFYYSCVIVTLQHR